ncbi:MAG: hypothetical protein A2017_16195 [Lentisphaerae bacterium GWF2_44_16]|nr:MAG: hypothetical protein A2017_16195 [Lentisphaerae bacterium GWF2_44_16]
MKKHFYPLSFLFISILLFTVSCETLEEALKDRTKEEEMNELQYIFSINEVIDYPRATGLEREITSFSGKKLWINVNPFIHSRDVEEIKKVPSEKPGFFDLQLKLTRRGRIMWTALTEQVRVTKFGVIIDGVFYRTFEPERIPKPEEAEWAAVKGPFDAVTADGLIKYAKSNFKHFQKD